MGVPTLGEGGGRLGWDKIPSFSKKFIWGLPLCLFLSVLPFSCLFLSAQTLTQAAAAAAADWHCERCWRQSQAFHLGNFSSGMPQHFFTPSKPHLCIVVNAPPTIELEGELNYMNPVVRTVSKCCRTWKYLPWNQHFCTKIVHTLQKGARFCNIHSRLDLRGGGKHKAVSGSQRCRQLSRSC